MNHFIGGNIFTYIKFKFLPYFKRNYKTNFDPMKKSVHSSII